MILCDIILIMLILNSVMIFIFIGILEVNKMIKPGSMADVVSREIKWLWQPFIPFSKVTLIQGDTGIGKTSILMKIMSDLSNGIYPPRMFNGNLQPQREGDPLKMYYITRENGIEDTVSPMLDVFDADRSFFMYQMEDQGHFILNKEDILECVRITGAKLIVVDPWQQFIEEKSSLSDNYAIRRMIEDVQSAAEETETAIILCGNYNKNIGSSFRRSLGASELSNTLRAILTVKQDADNDNRRYIIASKMSFMGKEMTPVVFERNDDYSIRYVYSEDEELAQEDNIETEIGIKITTKVPSKGDRTVEFLRDILMDGPMDSKEIKLMAQQEGIPIATLLRAKKKAGIISDRQPDKSSLWKLNK